MKNMTNIELFERYMLVCTLRKFLAIQASQYMYVAYVLCSKVSSILRLQIRLPPVLDSNFKGTLGKERGPKLKLS